MTLSGKESTTEHNRPVVRLRWTDRDVEVTALERRLRRQAWMLARFAVRTVAAIATVHAVDVWILRLDPAWQLVAIDGVSGASALVAALPPARSSDGTRNGGVDRAGARTRAGEQESPSRPHAAVGQPDLCEEKATLPRYCLLRRCRPHLAG